jgi:hypothetical protein
MRKWKQKIASLITKIMERLPGGELRGCKNISRYNTECIERLGHRGRCEDAWFQKWNPEDSL